MPPALCPSTRWQDATAGAIHLSPPTPSPMARMDLKRGDGNTLQPWGRGQWGISRAAGTAWLCLPPAYLQEGGVGGIQLGVALHLQARGMV